MSSDDDVPAPSPSAAVLARRASREAKSMREEPSSSAHATQSIRRGGMMLRANEIEELSSEDEDEDDE